MTHFCILNNTTKQGLQTEEVKTWMKAAMAKILNTNSFSWKQLIHYQLEIFVAGENIESLLEKNIWGLVFFSQQYLANC